MCLCVAWFDCRYCVAALVVQWAVAGQSLGKEFTAPRNPKSLLFAHDVDVMVRALLDDRMLGVVAQRQYSGRRTTAVRGHDLGWTVTREV